MGAVLKCSKGNTTKKSSDENLPKCPFASGIDKSNKLLQTSEIKRIELRNYQNGETVEVTGPGTNSYGDCRHHVCTSTFMSLSVHSHQNLPGGSNTNPVDEFKSLDPDYLRNEAKDYLLIYHQDMKTSKNDYENRLKQVEKEIAETGIYVHTSEELEYGCQLAWRNASRCINRLFWKTIKLIDRRQIKTNDGMFQAICEHIRFGYNQGTLQASVLVMNPKSRVWSTQYFRYACYEQTDGTLLGDPANKELTSIAMKLGWKKNEDERSQWDVLPIIVQVEPNVEPSWYELPDDIRYQVFLSHPNPIYDRAIKSLQLRWFAQPYVSDKAIEIGGIFYRCVPFSGWFMETEIGRNLCDIQRYNFIPQLANFLNLDITIAANSQLNVDRLYVEVNAAILYTFEQAKIAIVDHHTAANGFMKFMKAEIKQRGNTPADWVWLVPPISGGMSSVFHQEMLNYVLKPRVVDQREPWLCYVPFKKQKDLSTMPTNVKVRHRWLTLQAARVVIGFALVAMKQRIAVNVLYASTSGTAYSYAQQLQKQLLYIGYNPILLELDSFAFLQTENYRSINLIITSTFGQGNSSDGGNKVEQWLKDDNKRSETTMRSPLMWCTYAVCAVGSSAYPFYCGFGQLIDEEFAKLGGTRLLPITMCDALHQQFQSYKQWEKAALQELKSVYPHACLRQEVPSEISTNRVEQEIDFNMSIRPVQIDLEFYPEKSKIPTDFEENKRPFNKDHPYNATVLENIELITKETLPQYNQSNINDEHSVRLIILDTKDLVYHPGDHIGVLPENTSANVDDFLISCGWNVDDPRLDQLCSLSSITNGKYETIREILTYFVDITTTPQPHVLNMIASFASNLNEQRQLLELGKGTQRYEDWKMNSPMIKEMFDQFPSIQIPINQIIQLLPRLQPRYYSISSSTRSCSNQLHLTVSVVKYVTIRGIIRHGICSRFLQQTKPLSAVEKDQASKVRLFIIPNQYFRLPEPEKVDFSLNNPLLMFAIGSGIAPFRSFWQELESLQKLKGNNEKNQIERILFFGCRTPNDFLYAKELELLTINEQILTKVIPVYSRENVAAKKYVQDVMLDYEELIYSILNHDKSIIYMCGSTRACQGIESALASIIETSNNGKLTTDEAINQIKLFKQNGKIKQDMFG